jgi:hypothetical protein
MDSIYMWCHSVFVFLCVAYFPYHNVHEIYPGGHLCYNIILFKTEWVLDPFFHWCMSRLSPHILLWIKEGRYLFYIQISFPWDIYLEVEFYDQMVIICFSFKGNSIPFFIHLFTYVYIVWVISPPLGSLPHPFSPHPLISRQNLFCPYL